MPRFKKLKGTDNAYRIRVSGFRLVFDLTDEVVTLTAFRPRDHVYS